jgi:hypothetical protein
MPATSVVGIFSLQNFSNQKIFVLQTSCLVVI